MFRTSKCSEEDQVEYATNLLRERAQHWWDVVSNALGEEAIKRLTWAEFKVKFNEEYCSDVAVRQLEEDFMQLRQGSNSVLQYTGEFTEKARFAEHQVISERRKIERFLWGLRAEIREFVKVSNASTFRQVVNSATDREIELNRQKAEKERQVEGSTTKRKWEGSTEQSSKRKEGGRFVSRKDDQRWSEAKWCDKCKKRHGGGCEPKTGGLLCYKCGKPGHMAKDCPETQPVCYLCGNAGHLRKDCPKASSGGVVGSRSAGTRDEKKASGGSGVRKQAYQMTVEEARDAPDVVSGIFLLNSIPVNVLFDSGATCSFGAIGLVDKLPSQKVVLKEALVVELADGSRLLIHECMKDCKLEIEGNVFPIELKPIAMKEFDVVVGMDWLAANNAHIICNDKVVVVNAEDKPQVVIRGERKGGNIKVAKMEKLRNEVEKDMGIRLYCNFGW